jgi:HPt (histidine-containing phosphotransfer) domain-containing protein
MLKQRTRVVDHARETGESVIRSAALDNIRQLNTPGQPDLLIELVAIYVQTVPGRLRQMRVLLQEKNLPALAKEAHTLKSSSANLGAHRVASLCEEVEALAKAEDGQGTLRAIENIENEYGLAADRLLHLTKQTSMGGARAA